MHRASARLDTRLFKEGHLTTAQITCTLKRAHTHTPTNAHKTEKHTKNHENHTQKKTNTNLHDSHKTNSQLEWWKTIDRYHYCTKTISKWSYWMTFARFMHNFVHTTESLLPHKSLSLASHPIPFELWLASVHYDTWCSCFMMARRPQRVTDQSGQLCLPLCI